jgi:hypothetical protein
MRKEVDDVAAMVFPVDYQNVRTKPLPFIQTSDHSQRALSRPSLSKAESPCCTASRHHTSSMTGPEAEDCEIIESRTGSHDCHECLFSRKLIRDYCIYAHLLR